MAKNSYIFEVSVKVADGSFHSFSTVGANINDVYYNFNDKVFNGEPVEIIQVTRTDRVVEGYSMNLELNPDYKPTENKLVEADTTAHALAPAPTIAPEG